MTDIRLGWFTSVIGKPTPSNGIPRPTYDMGRWLKLSGQVGKRHPLSPEGECIPCGGAHLGRWVWDSYEPGEGYASEER